MQKTLSPYECQMTTCHRPTIYMSSIKNEKSWQTIHPHREHTFDIHLPSLLPSTPPIHPPSLDLARPYDSPPPRTLYMTKRRRAFVPLFVFPHLFGYLSRRPRNLYHRPANAPLRPSSLVPSVHCHRPPPSSLAPLHRPSPASVVPPPSSAPSVVPLHDRPSPQPRQTKCNKPIEISCQNRDKTFPLSSRDVRWNNTRNDP